MIIDFNYLLDFGLPISDEISEDKLTRAISIAEQYIMKPRLGYDLYISILEAIDDHSHDFDVVLDGGVLEDGERRIYVSGLRQAEAHLAFAVLLRYNVNSTTFGSVLKDDEYSSHADEDRLRHVAMVNTEIGMAYLKEITDWFKIDNSGKFHDNMWEELI